MDVYKERAEFFKKAIAEHVAAKYGKEMQIFDDGSGFLFCTVAQKGMTDSFKLVVSYRLKERAFCVEVQNSEDSETADFLFPSLETAVAAYMALFTFFNERILSRMRDI